MLCLTHVDTRSLTWKQPHLDMWQSMKEKQVGGKWRLINIVWNCENDAKLKAWQSEANVVFLSDEDSLIIVVDED